MKMDMMCEAMEDEMMQLDDSPQRRLADLCHGTVTANVKIES